jgi:hypothetical protein
MDEPDATSVAPMPLPGVVTETEDVSVWGRARLVGQASCLSFRDRQDGTVPELTDERGKNVYETARHHRPLPVHYTDRWC